MSGFITITSLISGIKSVSIEIAGHEIAWQVLALIGFIMFAVFMSWLVIESRQDPARIEVRKDYLKEHLEAIKSLIEQWKSDIETPTISQIGLDFSGIFVFSEGNSLFSSLRKHLPNQNMWRNYELWKATAKEYIDSCKQLRTKIRESWTIGEVEINYDFEQPIVRLLARQDKELRYKLLVACDHNLSELKYQILVVNDNDAVLKHPSANCYVSPLKDEQCNGEILPLEYQKIADHFLQSDVTKELMELRKKVFGLEITMQNSLQNMLLASEHSKNKCEYCRSLV